MKVIHPKTKAALIMNECGPWIAEVESPDAGQPDYVSVTIGEIGYSNALVVYRDNWAAFKELVNEIDAEWTV